MKASEGRYIGDVRNKLAPTDDQINLLICNIVPSGTMYLAFIFHTACKVQRKPLEVHVLLQENLSSL